MADKVVQFSATLSDLNSSVLRAAMWYREQKLHVIPIAPTGEEGAGKQPRSPIRPDGLHSDKGWKEEIPSDWFKSTWGDSGYGVAVANIAPFGCIDLDCQEAITAFERLGPACRAIAGRKSASRSHLYFTLTNDGGLLPNEEREKVMRLEKVVDPSGSADKNTIIELRVAPDFSSSLYTVMPPTVHPSGETWLWVSEPAFLDIGYFALRKAMRRVGAAVLLARDWLRSEGRRNDMNMALAGALKNLGWAEDEIINFTETVRIIGGDADDPSRKISVLRTIKRDDERKTRGWPWLRGCLDDNRAAKVAELLEIRPTLEEATSEVIELMRRLGARIMTYEGKTRVAFTSRTASKDGHITYSTGRLEEQVFVKHLGPELKALADKVPSGKGKLTPKLLFENVINHPDRPYANTSAFLRNGTCPDDVWNEWCGFGVEPVQYEMATLKPLLDMVHIGLAHNEKDRTHFILSWAAEMIQNADEEMRPGSVLCLIGDGGTGKSTFAAIMGKILGPHYYSVGTAKDMESGFNSNMANKILITFDELRITSDVRDRIKDGATRALQRLERKNVDAYEVPNHVRYLLLSNRDRPVEGLTAQDSRRFVIFRSNPDYVGEKIFAPLWKWMRDGRHLGMFLDYLMKYEYSLIDLRQGMDTEEARLARAKSMEYIDQFVMRCLMDRRVAGEAWEEGKKVLTSRIAYAASDFCKQASGRGISELYAIKVFRERIGLPAAREARDRERRADGSRPSFIRLPKWEDAIDEFESKMKVGVWREVASEEESDI